MATPISNGRWVCISQKSGKAHTADSTAAAMHTGRLPTRSDSAANPSVEAAITGAATISSISIVVLSMCSVAVA